MLNILTDKLFWFRTGDDCVSIQTGCTNVYVHNINCGPGHGISIGSLGKDNTKACVSNITVKDVVMQNTMNGVRIKTWQVWSGKCLVVLTSSKTFLLLDYILLRIRFEELEFKCSL